MTWWQNLRTLWPGALRQQVTRAGFTYGGTIGIVFLAALLSANNLLFLILAAMISILFISGFVSQTHPRRTRNRSPAPPHISARRKFRATVRVKNLKRWMPSFSIHVTGAPDGKHPSGYDGALFYPAIPGGVALEEPIDLRFPARGRYSERTFQLTTRFPFGFAERRERVTLRHEVIVYPCLEPRPRFQALADALAGELEAWRRGPGHDFYRIRPYEALESARHVDWKATAHTRSLQVREFARDEDQMIVIYLDLDATARSRSLVRNRRRVRCLRRLPPGRHRPPRPPAHPGIRSRRARRRRRLRHPQIPGRRHRGEWAPAPPKPTSPAPCKSSYPRIRSACRPSDGAAAAAPTSSDPMRSAKNRHRVGSAGTLPSRYNPPTAYGRNRLGRQRRSHSPTR